MEKVPWMVLPGQLKEWFWGAEIKQIHDKHSGRNYDGGFKGCAVHSINLPFPRWWDNWVTVWQSCSIHSWNSWYSLWQTFFQLFFQMEFVFYNFIDIEQSWAFSCSILLSSKHSCVRSYRWTLSCKWNVASESFLQDMAPLRIFWKITFQLTLKICDLNSDVNDSFLMSYMFDLAIWRLQFLIFKDMWLW